MKKILLITCSLVAFLITAQGSGGQQLPKLPKTLDGICRDMADQSKKTEGHSLFDTGGGGPGQTGGTLPSGGGKKGPNDFALVSDTGGHGQSIDPGKKLDCATTAETTLLRCNIGKPDTGGTVPVGSGKKQDVATGGTGGIKLPPDGKKLDVA